MPPSDAPALVQDFDLNLLRFLKALVDTASVTKAGDVLGMSQPSASKTMARLRVVFRDPLLVRTGKGYVLTPLAEQLAPLVRQALAAGNAVFEAAGFDAATSSRRFRIATTDYGMSGVLLRLLPLLGREAPQVGLLVDPWVDQTIERLERGELDCALCADDFLPNDFHFRTLFRDGYALLCAASHPLARLREHSARAVLEAAAAYPQFAVRYPTRLQYATDDVYRTLGLPSPAFRVEAPYFLAGRGATAQGLLVGIVPERSAQLWAQDEGMHVVPLDEPALSFEYRLVWHERSHRDPGLVWLRDAIVRTIAAPPEG